MKNILFLSLFLMLASCTPSGVSRATVDNKPVEPGKCFSKCRILEELSLGGDTALPIYTGSNPDDVFFLTAEVEIEPARSKWVKKKADRNCLSSDPEDCRVWCLVEEPAKYKTISYLADTTQTKDFVMKKVKLESAQEATLVWQESPCGNGFINTVIDDIQLALRDEVAEDLSLSGTFDSATKKALWDFQIANNLCLGALTIETLEALDIDAEARTTVIRSYR